jgi:hypothetical protein
MQFPYHELAHSPPNRDENRPAKLSDADALGSNADDRVGLEVIVEGVVEAVVEAGVEAGVVFAVVELVDEVDLVEVPSSPASPLKMLLELDPEEEPEPKPVKEPRRPVKRFVELPPVNAPKRPLRSVLFGPKAMSKESTRIWIKGTSPVITKLFNTCS